MQKNAAFLFYKLSFLVAHLGVFVLTGCESKTLMLVHIRPNEDDLCESICTLGFATRVRSIRLENEEPQVSFSVTTSLYIFKKTKKGQLCPLL
jgi:hypothetical protein